MNHDARKSEELFQAVEAYIRLNYDETSYSPELAGPARDVCLFSMAASAKAVSPRKVVKELLYALLTPTEKTFVEELMRLIKKRGRKASDVYGEAGITRQHFSKIKHDANYQPTKETAIAFAVALHLTLDETKDLIGRAGFTLSKSSKRDLVVEYFIKEKIYDVDAINYNLHLRGFATLTNQRGAIKR